MSSGTEIIQKALKRIGAHSFAMPALPESIVEGRDTLNSLLQLWLSQGIDLKTVPLDAPGDELGEPLDTKEAIIDNLAIALAPNFDNGKLIVSESLKRNAIFGKSLIQGIYQNVVIPDKVVSGTLPLGQGSRRRFSNRIFAGKGATVS